MVRSNVHRAVGICVVCAGLMMGTGTAVSAAEPDPGGPGNAQSSGAGPGSQHRSKAAPGETPAMRAAEILRKTISDVTSVFGSGRVPGQQPPKTPEPAKVDTPVTASSENNEAGAASPASSVSLSTSDTVSPTPDITTPVTNTDPPATDPVTPVVTDTAPPVVEPVVDPAPVPAPATVPVPAAVSWPTNPVIDVISSVQYMVTSVVHSLAPIATDLGSLLGVTQWSPAVNVIQPDGPPAVPGTAVPLFAASSVLSPLPEIPTQGLAGLPMSNEAGTATVGTAATASAGELETAPAVVPLPHAAAIPMSVKEFFGHAVREVLRSPSLSALAALALPGVLGLFVITGAGIRFGYRQAKAALSLPASGLVRFAPPQPLRLVRSRSVAVSAPAVRFVPREIRGIGPSLKNAA